MLGDGPVAGLDAAVEERATKGAIDVLGTRLIDASLRGRIHLLRQAREYLADPGRTLHDHETPARTDSPTSSAGSGRSSSLSSNCSVPAITWGETLG